MYVSFSQVEMVSHYGSEHFCPISLFRVYGTSEFEVLETEDLAPDIPEDDDDDDDDDLDSYNGEATNNLFGSARDAVISIVKKAAEVLVKTSDSNKTEKGDNSTKYTPLINTCTTPSRIVVCNNCSEIMFGSVYELLSCKSLHLKKLLDLNIFSNLLYNTDVCVDYGLSFLSKSPEKFTKSQALYVSRFFPPKYIAAFCNVLAIMENKVVLNVSSDYVNTSATIEKATIEDVIALPGKSALRPLKDSALETKTCTGTIDTAPDVTEEPPPESTLEIKPTKTLTSKVEIKLEPSSEPMDIPIVPTRQENLPQTETVGEVASSVANVTKDEEEAKVAEEATESYEIGEQFDTLLSELEAESSAPTTVAPPSNVPQQAKESVFLRLSSRIKVRKRRILAAVESLSLSIPGARAEHVALGAVPRGAEPSLQEAGRGDAESVREETLVGQ